MIATFAARQGEELTWIGNVSLAGTCPLASSAVDDALLVSSDERRFLEEATAGMEVRDARAVAASKYA